MTIKARQFSLAASTATALLPPATFSNLAGATQDPLPVVVKNEDASATMWIGGPDVSATNGQSLTAGQSLPMALYANDYPWVFTTSGSSPIVSVLVGRQ